MPKIGYKSLTLRKSTLEQIQIANEIIEEYSRQGFKLTIRQLYYQFVARNIFPDARRWRWTGSKWEKDPGGTKNAQPNYKWLIDMINKGRLAGFIDWYAIEDRTRAVRRLPHWNTPGAIIAGCAYSYNLDKWVDQEYRVEVWIEKEALAGVVEEVCCELDIPFFCCRGYTSQSAMWSSAMRLDRLAEDQGQTPLILYLGDHDPSGIDMTRDIEDRLEMFVGGVEYGSGSEKKHSFGPGKIDRLPVWRIRAKIRF